MTNKSDLNYTTAGSWWRKYFKKPKLVERDDVGIYKYIFLMDTINEDSHSHKYNIFAKVKAIAVYEETIETDLINLHINEPITDEVLAIIKKNFPKYVDPKLVKWEIK